MTDSACDRITLADLTDYAAGELTDADAAVIEEHLFTCTACGARAAEFDALVRAIGAAAQSAGIGGFVTEAVLNRLSRDGVRVRTFTLAPGAMVPCAVWEGDELMVLRLRGDFGAVEEITLSQRVAGNEVSRASGAIVASARDEIMFATPAAWIRELPAVNIDLQLTATEAGEERPIARYTLVHGGPLHR
jgi:anti-sigma factor RsiW